MAYVKTVVAEDDRFARRVEELAGVDEGVELLKSFGVAYCGHLALKAVVGLSKWLSNVAAVFQLNNLKLGRRSTVNLARESCVPSSPDDTLSCPALSLSQSIQEHNSVDDDLNVRVLQDMSSAARIHRDISSQDEPGVEQEAGSLHVCLQVPLSFPTM